MICNLGDPMSLGHPVRIPLIFSHFDSPVVWKTMGWLRLVGFLKWYVSFAREPYTRDDTLQQRRIILRTLLIVATPYDFSHFWMRSFSIQPIPLNRRQKKWDTLWIAMGWLRLVGSLRLNVSFAFQYSLSHWIDALSKFRSESSKISFLTFQWTETYELWASRFGKKCENAIWNGIPCGLLWGGYD